MELDLACASAGLHLDSTSKGEDTSIVDLTFPDPNRVLSRYSDTTLQLTGALACSPGHEDHTCAAQKCAAPQW